MMMKRKIMMIHRHLKQPFWLNNAQAYEKKIQRNIIQVCVHVLNIICQQSVSDLDHNEIIKLLWNLNGTAWTSWNCHKCGVCMWGVWVWENRFVFIRWKATPSLYFSGASRRLLEEAAVSTHTLLSSLCGDHGAFAVGHNQWSRLERSVRFGCQFMKRWRCVSFSVDGLVGGTHVPC